MSNLKDLIAQRDALEQKIRETQAQEHEAALSQIRSLMTDYGITLADLGARSPKSVKAPGKVAVKYRNQATGESWSGRGLQPKWLKAAIAGGAKLEDFHV